jgi:glutathione synthase/RimK-type ligase-like ATP-grasp enzyme
MGGCVQPVQLDTRYIQLAVRSAQVLGLKVAGVDIL